MSWIIGTTFLHNNYLYFDYENKKIGILSKTHFQLGYFNIGTLFLILLMIVMILFVLISY